METLNIRRICGIYKITAPDGRVYIGQSTNILQRVFQHSQGLKSATALKVFSSIEKHGWGAHTVEVVEECNKNSLSQKERFWQDYYDCTNIDKGLNTYLTSTASDNKSGKTVAKNHRFPRDVWEKVETRAKELNVSCTDILVGALIKHLKIKEKF